MGFLDDRKRRAALGYLLLLLPLTALLLFLLTFGDHGSLQWTDLVLFAVPLCVVFAFLCRSSLYMCRALHPARVGLRTLIIAHFIAALAASAVWQLAARGSIHLFRPDAQVLLTARLPLLFGLGLTYYLLCVVFHYLVLTMQERFAAEQRLIEAQTLAREAELKALHAQLNPHFLFNALNSITALTSTAPDRARDMTITLSEFLRGSLGVGDKHTISFAEELGLSRRYLEIELIRFSDRMELQQDIDADALDAQVPPLILQPLVENAVKHGVAGLVSGGWVQLTAHRQDDRLHVTVENNHDPAAPRRTGGGHGLRIARQRLATYYGDDAALRVSTEERPDGTAVYRAELRLPTTAPTAPTPHPDQGKHHDN